MAGTKAQLEISADASGVKTGVADAKRSLADLGATAVSEGKKAAAGIEAAGAGAKKAADAFSREEGRMRASIQRTTLDLQTLGRSASEKFEAKISLQGLDSSKFQPYLAQLRAVEEAQRKVDDGFKGLGVRSNSAIVDEARKIREAFNQIKATGLTDEIERARTAVTAKMAALRAEFDGTAKTANTSLNRVGVSAAQTAAAMRMVPAQFTDIVTSLQGGQAPFTVLLQQGGQLKDMFGGIGPATRALGTYIGGLVSPFTLVAAAVGVLALAYYQATERTLAFNKALISTGNYVGQSAAQLDELAQKISKTVGTQGQATDALVALASSGKVAGDQLQLVGTAIVAENKAMGTSVKDLVEQYASLAEDPVKASEKLNNSLHYLTQATYDRIRALAEQGDKEQAVALAQSELAKSSIDRMQSIINQTGLLSKALSGTRDIAMGMWNAIAGGLGSIGAQQSAAEKLIDAQRKVAFLTQNGSTPEALAAARGDVVSLSRQALREQDVALAQGQRARDEAAKISASDRIKTLSDEVRTNADKRKKAIADLDRDFKQLGKATSGAEYDKLVANINEKYKDPKEAKGKAFQDDAGTKMLETLRQTEAALRDQLGGENRITDAQKKQVEFQQLIADLKTKKVLTADQKSLLADKDAINAQLQKNIGLANQLEFEKKIAEIVKKSAQDAAEFARQMQAINISIEAGQESRDQQSDRALGAFGLGDRARQQVDAQKTIRAEFQRYLTTAAKDAAEKDQLGSKEYADQVDRIKEALDRALKAQTDYFDALKSKQADWKNGATTALANYIDTINDVAKRTEDLVGSSLTGFTDGLTKAVMGEKGSSFKDIGKSIATQIVRGMIETNITLPIAKWLQKELSGDSLGDFLKKNDNFGTGGSSGDGLGGFLGSIGKFFSNLFSDGGYTGPGGKYDPAGIVHAGEYVMTAEATKALGIDFLDRLNKRGYADGGYVGTVLGGSTRQAAGTGAAPAVIVHQNFTVGDVASVSMLRQAVAGSEARLTQGLRRSRQYAGEAAQ